MRKWMIALIIIVTGMAGSVAAAVSTNDPAPDFTLTDTYGEEVVLSDYRGDYVVLEWWNKDCPFVKKHYDSQNMQDLQSEMTSDDVVWLTVVSSAPGNQGYVSPEEANEVMEEKGGSPTAILLDEDGSVGRLYGAKTTPHMFVVDPDGVLIYQGAIDDKPSTDPGDVATATNYVRLALQEAKAGKPVSHPSTKSYGCSVKY